MPVLDAVVVLSLPGPTSGQGGSVWNLVEAYHCKVASCDEVPNGTSLSRC